MTTRRDFLKAGTAAVTLFPQDFAGTAIEMQLTRDKRDVKRFPVHVGKHEQRAVARVGDDGGNQAVLIKLQMKRLRFIEGACH